MKNTAPRPVTGPIRRQINKLAHSHGLQHETRLRDAMLKQVQAARDGGATFDELANLVDNVQTMDDLAAMTSTPEQQRAWAELVAGLPTVAQAFAKCA